MTRRRWDVKTNTSSVAEFGLGTSFRLRGDAANLFTAGSMKAIEVPCTGMKMRNNLNFSHINNVSTAVAILAS